jgi:hypothetical protein
MKKKSKAEVAKMVDAQAKGKKSRSARTDDKTPDGRELDTRRSKAIKLSKFW